MSGARLDVDDWLEIAVELEDIRRRVGEVGIRVKEMIALQKSVPSPTATGTAGTPCAGEIHWTKPALRHDYAPPPHAADATVCMEDEPPSRPA